MAPIVDPEETIAQLPVGRGATLPTGAGELQPDLARETTRGESMRGNLAEAAPGFFARLQGGDPKTLKGVAAMLFALSDAADRLTLRGQERGGGNRAMDFLMQTEKLDLARSAETRAQKGEERAERQVSLQERGGELEKQRVEMADRAQFLNELLTIAPRLFAASDEDRFKAVGALEQRAAQFGLQPIVRGLTGDANIAKLAGQYAPLLTKYGSVGLGLAVNQLFAKGDAAGALKLVEEQLKPYAMVEARDSVRTTITNLSDGDKRPSYSDVLASVRGHNPLYARVIEQNPDFYSGEFALRGVKTPKISEKEAEARAGRETPKELKEGTKAKTAGELEAKQEAGVIEGKTLVERIQELRSTGKPEDKQRAEALLKTERELREAGAVKFPPQLPAGSIEKIADMRNFVGILDDIEKSHKPAFTGPISGRLGAVAQTTGIGATKKETAFRTRVASLRNQVLHLRSGAAITPSEAERLLEELPTSTDPSTVFLSKLKTARTLMRQFAKTRTQALAEFGFKQGGQLEILSIEQIK